MLTASALNSSEYRRRVFLVMNTSNASSMRLTGVSAPIRPVHPQLGHFTWPLTLLSVKQQRGVVLTGDSTGQGDAFQSALDLAMHPGPDRSELGHLDPVVAGLDADAVIAGLFAPLALEARMAGLLLGVEEALEGMIEVQARLLEGDGVSVF